MGTGCWINHIDVPRNPWDIWLGDQVALDDGVVLLTTGERCAEPRLLLRSQCYVNRFTMFDATERIEIGEHTMIGPFCYVTDHDHGTDGGRCVASQPFESAPVRIGHDVWIGAGVIILKGVTIGDGAVIGAGTVVTRDVPPNGKVAGVPGRVFGTRTSLADQCSTTSQSCEVAVAP